MKLSKYKLVLASKSPRRKELLGWLNVPFLIDPPEVDEVTTQEVPRLVAEEIATLKGDGLHKKYQEEAPGYNPLIVASDTIVLDGDKILGKPKDRSDAKAILSSLGGKVHKVITAVYIGGSIDGTWTKRVFSCQSSVTFEKITDDIMEFYLDSKEPFDKAGAYGIQGQGLLFISHLEGSYSNVVGFPLSHFVSELKCFLGLKNDDKGTWRDLFE